jgi:Protein of unknown function (DUF2946)
MRSFASWIACLGLLMAALAPTISHAMHLASLADGTTMCPQMAAMHASVDEPHGAGPAQPSQPASHAFEHCPYCTLHAYAAGSLPASPTLVALLDLRFQLPQPRPVPIARSGEWTAPQPRAPPLFA